MKKWLSETLDLGIHALTGGQGATVVLVPGWPEQRKAFILSDMMLAHGSPMPGQRSFRIA